nr:recombinase family protein [Anaeromyxobacter sp. Fw109-5]
MRDACASSLQNAPTTRGAARWRWRPRAGSRPRRAASAPSRHSRRRRSPAGVVRRIFQLYAESHGLKQITSLLNEEGVPAPYDDAYRKQGGRGWGPGTIRFMLKNERYIGRSVWKERMWVTDPATGARTYRMRGEDECVTTEQSHLAIVSKELWDRVQARFAERKVAKGRARGSGSNGHLLTGLLRCGECGSTMRVVSVKWKAGRAYANFGCSAPHRKGAAICGNGLVISERKLNRAVIEELRKLLASKEIQTRFVDGFTKRLQHKSPRTIASAALEAEVKAQEARVRNVTAAIARSGFSEALAEQLGLEEETMRSDHNAVKPAVVLKIENGAGHYVATIVSESPRSSPQATGRPRSPTLTPWRGSSRRSSRSPRAHRSGRACRCPASSCRSPSSP